MSKWKRTNIQALSDPTTGALVGFMGPDNLEYMFPMSVGDANGVAGPTQGMTSLLVRAAGAGTGTVLTNPLVQAVGQVNNYTQSGIQNLSNGVNASSDHIAYPDNNTTDGTGFIDIGITSSGFAQAAYSVTGPNEPYVFGSNPSSNAAGSGDLVIATDSTGTSNGIRFYTNGFAQALGNWAMRLTGTGLLQVAKGLANTAKVFANNGATTTYTVPANTSYVYLTTTAASLTITLPAASAAIDGLIITIVPSAVVATLSWLSTGATFVGALTAFALNTPVRLIYDHASLKWYPA